MILFDKKFVHFMWEDELEGKEGFFSDHINNIIDYVNNYKKDYISKVRKSERDDFPFEKRDDGSCSWTFFYYDPNYEIKRAREEGKQIQIKKKDCFADWIDCDYPDFDDNREYEFRVKPEVKRMTYRQLTEWCLKGHGQYKLEGHVFFDLIASYGLDYDNVEVGEKYKIRKWGSNEWIEPTLDVYEADCKE